MTVTITIEARDAIEARAQMANLIYGSNVTVSAPAVYDTSSDKPLVLDTAGFLGDTGGDPTVTGKPVEQVQPTKRTRKTKDKPVEVIPPTEAQNAAFNEAVDKTVEADAAQDAADEAAETETTGDAPLTLDDVRNSALPYITKWGKEAAAKDLVPIVMAAGGVPNIGKLDPADQPLLRKVMVAFADAAKAETRFVAAA